MESAQERVYLILHVQIHLVECQLLDILNFVVVCHRDVRSIFFERKLFVSSEVVSGDCKVLSKICNIVVEGPLIIPKAIVVHIGKVFEEKFLANHHLVKRSGKEAL